MQVLSVEEVFEVSGGATEPGLGQIVPTPATVIIPIVILAVATWFQGYSYYMNATQGQFA